jgi:hypothetical protein
LLCPALRFCDRTCPSSCPSSSPSWTQCRKLISSLQATTLPGLQAKSHYTGDTVRSACPFSIGWIPTWHLYRTRFPTLGSSAYPPPCSYIAEPHQPEELDGECGRDHWTDWTCPARRGRTPFRVVRAGLVCLRTDRVGRGPVQTDRCLDHRCQALVDIKDNDEKDSAFRGFCKLIQTNPAGVAKVWRSSGEAQNECSLTSVLTQSFMWFCNAVVRWQHPSPELNEMFAHVSFHSHHKTRLYTC